MDLSAPCLSTIPRLNPSWAPDLPSAFLVNIIWFDICRWIVKITSSQSRCRVVRKHHLIRSSWRNVTSAKCRVTTIFCRSVASKNFQNFLINRLRFSWAHCNDSVACYVGRSVGQKLKWCEQDYNRVICTKTISIHACLSAPCKNSSISRTKASSTNSTWVGAHSLLNFRYIYLALFASYPLYHSFILPRFRLYLYAIFST